MVERTVPAEKNKAAIITKVKNKGSRLDRGNYRGKSVISVSSKLFMRVLLNSTKPNIEELLREQQAGLRVGRSTVDQIFALRQLMETRWEYAQPIYLLRIHEP